MKEKKLSSDIKKSDTKLNIKLENFLVKTALVIFTIILIFLFLRATTYTAYFLNSSIDHYHEGLYYEKDNILLNIAGVFGFILVILGIYKIFSKKNKLLLIILSLIIVGILGFSWVNFVKAPIKSDQRIVFSAAITFKNNDYSFLDGQDYLFLHPLQLGCILGLELLMKLINNTSLLIFQNINVLFLIGCSILLILISNKIYKNETVLKILSILLMFFLIIPLYSIVVYGSIYGLFFSLLAIFFLLKFYENYHKRYIFLIALSISIAIIFKSNYQIFMIGILISLFIDIVNKFKFKTILAILLILICFGISYPIIYKIVETRSGKELNEGVPMLSYIAMAIQEPVSRNSGWYHDTKNVETLYRENGNDSEATIEESKEIISSRLKGFASNPEATIHFFLDKISSTWIEPAFQTFWWSEPLEEYDLQSQEYKEYITNNELLLDILHGDLHITLLKYLDFVEITIFAMSFISVIFGIKQKKLNYKNFILLVIFIGGFLFHILWETKCIYVIPYYMLLLPSAANGIDEIRILFNKLLQTLYNKIKSKKQHSNQEQTDN